MKVIKTFRDKHTKKVYKKGSKFEGSKERVEELQKLGFLDKPKKKSTKKEDK